MEENKKLGVDDSRIQWQEFESANGKTFQVGYLDTNDKEMDAESLGKEDFGIAVTWNVDDPVWKETTRHIRAVSAIKRYKLHEHSGSYDYCLEFTNEAHYNYQFVDETGDIYRVNTFINRDHYLLYNSEKPAIICVRGS